MNKLIYLLSAIALLACTQKDPSKKVEINGELTGGKEGTIYVEAFTPSAINLIDSAKVDGDGNFTLNLKVTEIGYYKLKLSENNFVFLILDTVENITLKADAENMARNYTVEGSAESKLLWELAQLRNTVITAQDSIQKAFKENQSNPAIDSIGAMLQKHYNQVMNSFLTDIKSFIDKNNSSFAALSATENLDPNTDFELFQKVEKGLSEKFPNSAYVNLLSRRVKDMSKLIAGSEVPDFTLSNQEGKPFNLSSLRGKVVLIDFWASWCGPCRKENPNVVKMFAKYKSKGFDIIGVSLDRQKEPWLKAIKDDKLEWNHVWDQNNVAASAYNATSIPFTVLIDKEGKLIAKGLRGEELEKKLEEILK